MERFVYVLDSLCENIIPLPVHWFKDSQVVDCVELHVESYIGKIEGIDTGH